MFVDALLGGAVVVGADDERRIGTGLRGILREPDRLRGGVATGAGHDEQAAGGGLDALGDHPLVFVVRERGGFAGRAHRADAGDARLGLEVDLLVKPLGVDRTVAKRGDNGDGQTGKLLGSRGHRQECSVGVS